MRFIGLGAGAVRRGFVSSSSNPEPLLQAETKPNLIDCFHAFVFLRRVFFGLWSSDYARRLTNILSLIPPLVFVAIQFIVTVSMSSAYS